MSWFAVELIVPEPLRDAVANRLFELGAEGVNETAEGMRGFFEDTHRATVAAELPPYLEALAELNPNLPRIGMTTNAVENTDWADRYKEFYKAQKLTHTFFLKPAWDKQTPVPDGMVPIVMDPGQAFGTGLHASTTLTLKLFESVLELHAKPEGVRLLDVGTGSGILAIAAEKLGVGELVAVDIDPIATATAEENAKTNGCRRIRFATGDLSAASGQFDIILSNILLEAHRHLAAGYRRLLKPGGQLVLSGLLVPQQAELEATMKAAGFKAETTESSQEWMAFVFRAE